MAAQVLMEKLDLVIVMVGGVILAAAIAGAALLDEGPESGTPFLLVFTNDAPQTISGSVAPVQAQGTLRAEIPVEIDRANLSVVTVDVVVRPTGAFPSGGSVLLRLTAPDGSVTEQDATTSPGATTMTVQVEAPLTPRPRDGIIQAAGFSDAHARLMAQSNHAGHGTWTIEVAASFGNVPPPQAEATWTLTYTTWSGTAHPEIGGR